MENSQGDKSNSAVHRANKARESSGLRLLARMIARKYLDNLRHANKSDADHRGEA